MPGNTETLSVTIVPDNANDKSVTWTSSKPEIATVENGMVKALSTGETVVTVVSADGKVSADCHVKVITPAITDVEFDVSSMELVVGSSDTVKVSTQPEGIAADQLVWTSDKTEVATVENGIVKALSVGKATITASTEDGQVSDSLEVNVVPVWVTGIVLSDGNISLVTGQSKTVRATVSPENATDKNVSWVSSDSSVATVNNGTITGVSAGTAVISALSADRRASKTCTVTVTAPKIQPTSVPTTAPAAIDYSSQINSIKNTKLKINKLKGTKKKISVSFSACRESGAYYQVAYKTSGRKWTVKVSSGTKFSISRLKKGKQYSIKVRCAKEINGQTYYGKWSKTGKIRIK